jgi:hypothetical protein
MGKINRWRYQAHPMPEKATEDQRIAWHTEHAKHCRCRKIEGGVAEMFRRRGPEVPDKVPTVCWRGASAFGGRVE